MLQFEWDDEKALINLEKHNISFEEAKTVFDDTYALYKHDPDHSDDEDRFVILGYSYELRILFVVHCYREKDSVIRIISARQATKKERKAYEGARNA